MKQLMRAEAERSARALDWVGLIEAVKRGWLEEPDDIGDYLYDYLYEAVSTVKTDRRTICIEWKELSLDPYFWFPRLWDRLEGIAPKGVFRVYVSMDSKTGVEWPDGYGLTQTTKNIDHPCLALCEAIEALEEE